MSNDIKEAYKIIKKENNKVSISETQENTFSKQELETKLSQINTEIQELTDTYNHNIKQRQILKEKLENALKEFK